MVTHARESTRRFLERFAAGASRASDGLVPALERWLGTPASFEDVWDVAFGRLSAASRGDAPEDIVRHAAAAALRIAERGAAGNWEARLDPTARMRVGASLLPAAERLRVSADGRHLEVQVHRGRRTWSWMLPQPVPFSAHLDGAENLSAARTGKDARILVLRKGAPGLDTSLEAAAADRDPDSIIPPLDAAFRLMGKYSRGTSMDPEGRSPDPSASRRARDDDEQHRGVETRHPLCCKPPRSLRSRRDAAPRGKPPVHVRPAQARAPRRRQRPVALLLADQRTDAAPRDDRAGLPRRREHRALLPRLPREQPHSSPTDREGVLRSDRGIRKDPVWKPRPDAFWSGSVGAALRAAARRRGCRRQRSPSVT